MTTPSSKEQMATCPACHGAADRPAYYDDEGECGHSFHDSRLPATTQEECCFVSPDGFTCRAYAGHRGNHSDGNGNEWPTFPAAPDGGVELVEELYKALCACQLQMLQSNNDSEYAREANEMAIRAKARAEEFRKKEGRNV